MTKVKVLDGSIATQVGAHTGKDADGDPLWTARFLVTDVDALRAAHLDYLRSGSDIIETDTYQATVDGFGKYLGKSEAESLELIRKAVDIAREAVKIYKEELKDNDDAVNRSPLVAGSCGPYGASLHNGSEYTGAYGKTVSKEFLKDWHRSRFRALVDAGVDLLAIETVPCVEEAEALVELLQEFPDTKAWMSFSCANDGERIADGSSFKDVAIKSYRSALPGQIIAVGMNCVNPRWVTKYLRSVHGSPEGKSVPLVVYPNSGEVYTAEEGWKDADGKLIENDQYVHEWLDHGVQYIGGCCRTGALHIAKIRGQVDTWKSQEQETSV